MLKWKLSKQSFSKKFLIIAKVIKRIKKILLMRIKPFINLINNIKKIINYNKKSNKI